jgi:hypothetical protein
MGGAGADSRAVALAEYLRTWAATFSLSADATGGQHTAVAGMALLDAANLAESMAAQDERLVALSEAGCFESMPNGTAVFVGTPRLMAVIRRPLSGAGMTGASILTALADSVREV